MLIILIDHDCNHQSLFLTSPTFLHFGPAATRNLRGFGDWLMFDASVIRGTARRTVVLGLYEISQNIQQPKKNGKGDVNPLKQLLIYIYCYILYIIYIWFLSFWVATIQYFDMLMVLIVRGPPRLVDIQSNQYRN